jgi:glycosyltransferase involved in cell wall biosynthesis
MRREKLKVLLIVEQCNPEWASVPLEGFRYHAALSRLAEVTLVTHVRNQAALVRAGVTGETVFMPESRAGQLYGKLAGWLSEYHGHINWPVRHALSYPAYAEFDWRVFHKLGEAVARGSYDVVHVFTPIMPRYPARIVKACRNTPFILGPVNGGLPFPAGFEDIAKKEFDRFTFLRGFARYIPGYRRTYQRADKILAGSGATLRMLRKIFAVTGDRFELLHENGVQSEFFVDRAPRLNHAIRLLFVGRLVPYKCADLVIEAMNLLAPDIRRRAALTIVGDGPERENLERSAQKLGIAGQVTFAGWVPQERTLEFYRQSDIFCFPSVREFGGAVVLEAMAAGLPCIVADYGGIAEYVTEGTGYRISLDSREHLRRQLTRRIEDLARDGELLAGMSARAIERAREFTWDSKAHRTVNIYETLIERKYARNSPQLAERGST